MYEQSTEERFVGEAEGDRGASGVTGARETAEGRVEEGTRGGTEEVRGTAEEAGQKQGFGDQVQGAKEKAQGAKDKLTEQGDKTGQGEKEETIEEKLRGKVSGWMKRDQ